jgi:outer membrane lipoprotein SlyB
MLVVAVSFTIPAEAANRHNNDRHREVCTYCGTVRSVSRINDRGHHKNTGAIVVGALIGGALGNQVGKGDGRRAATVVGAVAGGAIANNATRDKNRRSSYRITVRMDTGRFYNFDQGSARGMHSGSRVVVRDGRVYPSN